MAANLWDLRQPVDVPLLDATVAAFYGTGSSEERHVADQILQDLQNNPDMWLQVVHILQNSHNLNTKFFALQVLENVIKYKWNALSIEQRDGIKSYISDVIVQLSRDDVSFRQERLFVNKLNIILVQVLKHEWPVRWASFIPDLVAAARSSETVCENCMAILKLLTEEIFDFSRGEMTQQRIQELKNSLNNEFHLIHELCLYVLSASQRPELIRATLATLYAFLSWMPIGFIFESPLLETLLKFFPVATYRNLTIQCLTEVATLYIGDFYNMQYVKMYRVFMSHLQEILPSGTVSDAYANGSNEDQEFVQNLALFFTSFFKYHLCTLEAIPENRGLLLLGLEYLIGISFVDDSEVFKVCLDYWNLFVLELFESCNLMQRTSALIMMGLQAQVIPRNVDDTIVQQRRQLCLGHISRSRSLMLRRIALEETQMIPGNVDDTVVQQRRQLYSGPISRLRTLMICRMAKPEEVLIVEDQNGNIVRETMKDSDVLVQYKIMRETLIYLSHLDHEDTEQQMLKKLSKQLNGEDWSWNNLNTLCWAIGSISGSMVVEQENKFLVMVIRDLLNLCEISEGTDNKAVIASNIMYVMGQYPRFLRKDWRFSKTVINKLFQFMHDMHPGVQDMACDTFLKIVQKCKRNFVTIQVSENEPFVSELLSNLAAIIADLQPQQIHTFYEAVGQMIQAESRSAKREEYVKRLMSLPNQKWAEIIGEAGQSIDVLKDQDVIRSVLNILQTNTSVASSLGRHFSPQISLIFLDMLTVYRMYSELVSDTIAEGGPFTLKTSFVKLLRSVKRETLKLIETFLDKAEDLPQLGKQFVPLMMDPVLRDYSRNVPDARESEVLSLFAAIINKYKGKMLEEVPQIFEAVFECTLEMITKNFEDYPEHRLKFFSLLHAIGTHCFQALIQLSSQQLKLVLDSISWAFRHTDRNIAETGLSLLLVVLKNFEASGLQNQFYKTYFLTIEQEIFAVLTDTFHKPCFKLHVSVLQHLFYVVDSITEPLWHATTVPSPYTSNTMFVRDYTIKLLSSSFPNMTPVEVVKFVDGLLSSKTDIPSFKDHIRDFLVQSKEFSAQDNNDLYAEEAAALREKERQRMLSIPGLIAPNELQDDDMVDS